AVPGGEQHLERDVGDLEHAFVFHLDVGLSAAVSVPPGQPVTRMHGHGRVVPLGDVESRRHVPGVTVSADHRDDIAVADDFEHGARRLTRVDDYDLVVITD